MEWRQKVTQPGQHPPDGDWRIWYIRGGRGGGKTWTGSHQLAEWILDDDNTGKDWAIIAPTFADARDVCMEGPSGLLRALGLPKHYKGWNRSHGELFLPQGGRVYCDGADDGALRIQGKNLAGVWADEVGLWKHWQLAWEESIGFAVRVDPALRIATGTPKRGHPLVAQLMDDEAVQKTLVTTEGNAANLSASALADLKRRYAGTELGKQELEGAILTDVPGALWNREMIDYGNAPETTFAGTLKPDYQRVVVAVDPAGTYGPDSDETGIVVCAVGADGRGYVLADYSGRFPVGEWANRVKLTYDRHEADAVVAEVNYGGDFVENTLRSVGFTGHYIRVVASRGKRIRAEPVAGLYGEGRVSHVRPFPELEDQLCTYTPDTLKSPDRLDALVWAFTELMLGAGVPGDFSLIA